MGKLKRNKNRKSRLNPINRNLSETSVLQKEFGIRQSKVGPLLEKLKSTVPDEKSLALGTITLLCEDAGMRALFLKERLIPTLVETLSDPSEDIGVESYGLLRNIGIEEGYDVMVYCWRLGIWDAIERSLQSIEERFNNLEQSSVSEQNNNNSSAKSDLQILFEYTENVLSLIIVIAEADDKLFDSVFQKIDRLLNVVVKLIMWNVANRRISTRLFNYLLEFVYEFCAGSDLFINKLRENSDFKLEILHQNLFLESNVNNLGKIYAVGITFHVEEEVTLPERRQELGCVILNIAFDSIVNIDLKSLNNNPSLAKGDNIDKILNDSTSTKEILAQVNGNNDNKRETDTCIQSLSVALDIIATIWEYLSHNEKTSETEEETLVNLSNSTLSLIQNKAGPILIELFKCVQQYNLSELLDKVIITLNNLCWLLLCNDHVPVGYYDNAARIWTLMCECAEKVDDIVIQKDIINALWATSKLLGETVSQFVSPLMFESLLSKSKDYVSGYVEQGSADQAILEFVLCSVGFLGNLSPTLGTPAVAQISDFLITLVDQFSFKETADPLAVEVCIDSLNCIYDMFADQFYDYDYEVYVKSNYNARLEKIIPHFKRLMKRVDKHKNPLLRSKADETWLNLTRFVAYKRSERQ